MERGLGLLRHADLPPVIRSRLGCLRGLHFGALWWLTGVYPSKASAGRPLEGNPVPGLPSPSDLLVQIQGLIGPGSICPFQYSPFIHRQGNLISQDVLLLSCWMSCWQPLLWLDQAGQRAPEGLPRCQSTHNPITTSVPDRRGKGDLGHVSGTHLE